MTKKESREVQALEPQYIFGLTVGSGNNCFFLNNDKIVYRASGVLVIHDIPGHSQRYVYLADSKKTITTMDLSHNKYGPVANDKTRAGGAPGNPAMGGSIRIIIANNKSQSGNVNFKSGSKNAKFVFIESNDLSS